MSHNPVIDRAVLDLLPEDLEGLKILDAGFGYGFFGFYLKTQFKSVPHVTGLEIHRPYIGRQEGLGIYDDLVDANVLDMPFPDSYFDVVLACELIEHLEKEDGFKMIMEVERVGKNLIIITTPLGFMPQKEYDDNKYQVHRSEWFLHEFVERGYNAKLVDMRSQMTRSIRLLDDLRRAFFSLPNGKEIVAWKSLI